jgi:hypothetical protein
MAEQLADGHSADLAQVANRNRAAAARLAVQ